jgi:hypothetical protein
MGFINPGTFPAMEVSCKPFAIMCCHNPKPREASIFHVLPMASCGNSVLMVPFSFKNEFL